MRDGILTKQHYHHHQPHSNLRLVLLSHEDHIDNLDFEGRRLLDGRRVITTPDGAKNLAPRPGVATIKSWETLTLLSPSMEAIGILLKFYAHIFQAARSPASFFALRHLE